jgi:WD40 repeat protein
VFRDQTNLPMSESLWSSIEAALARSEYFVLMASPGAAGSPWVAREVDYWRRHRERSTFRIVLTGGRIEWDAGHDDFDWSRTDALPQAVISGWFPEQPGWVDVRPPAGEQVRHNQRNDRLRDAARTIAAPMYDMEKDQLDGEDERESRRARRTLQGGIAALVLLTVIAVTAALLAVGQLNEARTQSRISLARQLAATSGSELSTNLDIANLLAAKAFRTDPNPQTRSALFRAVTTSGNLVRYLPFGGHVSKLAGSADGSTVVVGLQDGRVLRWRLADRAPERLFGLAGDVKALAVSVDGSVVAASDGSTAMLARPHVEPIPLTVPSGQQPGAVAVSPSGRTAVVAGAARQSETSIVAYDVPSAAVRRVERDPHPELTFGPSLMVASDDEVFLLDGNEGGWERRRLADWSLVENSSAGFTMRNYSVGTSGDGRSFSYTNGSTTIPIWRTRGPTDPNRPNSTAQAPIARPSALTLNADGSRAAVADSGVIYVVPVLAPGAPREAPIQLVGNSSINNDGLRFLGPGGNRLISASADRVALWDLEQPDRLGHSFPVPMSFGCSACGGPSVAVSPDGSRVAAVDGSEVAGVVVPLDHPEQRQLLPNVAMRMHYGPPLWDRDGRQVTILVQLDKKDSLPDGLPAVVRGLPTAPRSGGIAAAGASADGQSVIVVEVDGEVEVLNIATGTLQQVTPSPLQIVGPSAPYASAAAVSATSDLVAVADATSFAVFVARTGAIRGRIPETGVRYLLFVGTRLLVQRDTGDLEVWDERAGTQERVLAGDPSYIWPPVPSPDGRFIARPRSDSSIVLTDLATGAVTTLAPSVAVPGRRVGMAFSADGTRFVTVTEGDDTSQGLVVYRDLSDEALVRVACVTAGRSLTAAEWHTLVGTDLPDDLGCR